MEQTTTIYLTKAIESLLTAESEFANGRYNSCANRSYYACFHAAIAAILNEGIRPVGQWNHQYVQAQFVGVLINKRKRYESELRRVLQTTKVFATKPITGLNWSPLPKRRGRSDARACSLPPFGREEVLPDEI
jgi:uncharacterized protein (UPF0332 family)